VRSKWFEVKDLNLSAIEEASIEGINTSNVFELNQLIKKCATGNNQ
jgi:hypothetical protein